jgi:LPXTG-motif cell wall-anchored protein
MTIAVTGILSDLGSILPSTGDIMQQVIIGAGAGVLLAGLKSNAGLDAIDPLHLIPRPAVPATDKTPAVPASVSTVIGKTVSGSVFAALTPAIQDRMMSQGYTVV